MDRDGPGSVGDARLRVTVARMVRDYTTDLYEPAAASSGAVTVANGALAAELATGRCRCPGVVAVGLDHLP